MFLDYDIILLEEVKLSSFWGLTKSRGLGLGLQTKAIRIISKLEHRDSFKDEFMDLKILTLPNMYILEEILY